MNTKDGDLLVVIGSKPAQVYFGGYSGPNPPLQSGSLVWASGTPAPSTEKATIDWPLGRVGTAVLIPIRSPDCVRPDGGCVIAANVQRGFTTRPDMLRTGSSVPSASSSSGSTTADGSQTHPCDGCPRLFRKKKLLVHPDAKRAFLGKEVCTDCFKRFAYCAQCQNPQTMSDPTCVVLASCGHKLCKECLTDLFTEDGIPVSDDDTTRRRVCPECLSHSLHAIAEDGDDSGPVGFTMADLS